MESLRFAAAVCHTRSNWAELCRWLQPRCCMQDCKTVGNKAKMLRCLVCAPPTAAAGSEGQRAWRCWPPATPAGRPPCPRGRTAGWARHVPARSASPRGRRGSTPGCPPSCARSCRPRSWRSGPPAGAQAAHNGAGIRRWAACRCAPQGWVQRLCEQRQLLPDPGSWRHRS